VKPALDDENHPSHSGGDSLSICVVACEPSGDALGEQVLMAIKKRFGTRVNVWGIGGASMMKAGEFESLVPLAGLAVGGLAFLKALPRLVVTLLKMRRLIHQRRPNVLMTFDAPDFNFRLSRVASKSVVKIHCVAPSVWAWRPKRAAKIARFLDHLCAILPFEPAYFERHNLRTTFVGHPMVERATKKQDLPLSSSNTLLLMPGSRVQEVTLLLKPFLATASKAMAVFPKLKVVVLTLPHLKEFVQSLVNGSLTKASVVVEEDAEARMSVMRDARAALVASGTSTLELGLAVCPMVVAYKVSRPLAFLLRRLVTTPFVALPNILLEKEVVPECLQERVREDILWSHLKPLLEEERVRLAQVKHLERLSNMLSANVPFGEGVVDVVEACIARKKSLAKY
jgi:lipid-A-disaccharide synthase